MRTPTDKTNFQRKAIYGTTLMIGMLVINATLRSQEWYISLSSLSRIGVAGLAGLGFGSVHFFFFRRLLKPSCR